MTTVREREGAREGAARPTTAARSVLPTVLGVRWWWGVLLALVLTVAGTATDVLRVGTVGLGFFIAYPLGCLLAVLWARRDELFAPMVQPPLQVAVAVPIVVAATGALPASRGLLSTALAVGGPLINAFPAMALTTLACLAIGWARIATQREATPGREGRDATRGRRAASPDAPPRRAADREAGDPDPDRRRTGRAPREDRPGRRARRDARREAERPAGGRPDEARPDPALTRTPDGHDDAEPTAPVTAPAAAAARDEEQHPTERLRRLRRGRPDGADAGRDGSGQRRSGEDGGRAEPAGRPRRVSLRESRSRTGPHGGRGRAAPDARDEPDAPTAPHPRGFGRSRREPQRPDGWGPPPA